jgi:macrophage erythroblast attacher
MPYELSRRNFKTAQRVIEHTSASQTTALKSASKSGSDTDTTLTNLDNMISKMQGLKRKLEVLHEEETRIHRSAKARLRHLQDLYDVHSLVDVKYEEWSRTRLSRLLVDYLLREGYSESAAHLAQSKGIAELVDVDAFVACHKIERSLREGTSTTLALEWCKEHGKELKKGGSMLEFELRLQQYIELVRQGHEAGFSGMEDMDMEDGSGQEGEGEGGGEKKLVEARAHAKKYLNSSGDFDLIRKAAGMLAYKPWDNVEPYAVSSFPLYFSRHHFLLIKYNSLSTHPPAGLTSQTSSSQHTTTYTHSHPAPTTKSPKVPVSPPSKHPLATRHTHPRRQTLPRPQLPSAPSAAPSSTS